MKALKTFLEKIKRVPPAFLLTLSMINSAGGAAATEREAFDQYLHDHIHPVRRGGRSRPANC